MSKFCTRYPDVPDTCIFIPPPVRAVLSINGIGGIYTNIWYMWYIWYNSNGRNKTLPKPLTGSLSSRTTVLWQVTECAAYPVRDFGNAAIPTRRIDSYKNSFQFFVRGDSLCTTLSGKKGVSIGRVFQNLADINTLQKFWGHSTREENRNAFDNKKLSRSLSQPLGHFEAKNA